MPGPMPYYLEKGPAFLLIESFANGKKKRLKKALERLRQVDAAGNHVNRVTASGLFDTNSFDVSIPDPTPGAGGALKAWVANDWKQHIDTHWFGLDGNVFWGGYSGENVEGVVREALVRAIELAFRIDHGADVPKLRVPWPIEFWWKCGQNWFETWLTWRPGLVSVMFATPSELVGIHKVWSSPIPPNTDKEGTDPLLGYSLNAMRFNSTTPGMAVVTHTTNEQEPAQVEPLVRWHQGRTVPPVVGATYRGKGPVVVVEPSETRGGIRPGGRQWTPT